MGSVAHKDPRNRSEAWPRQARWLRVLTAAWTAWAVGAAPTCAWAEPPSEDATAADEALPLPPKSGWNPRSHVLEGERAPEADRHEALAWLVWTSGIAVGLAGAGLGIAAAVGRADLESQWVRDPKTHLIETMTYDDAVSRRDAIHTQHIAAAVLGGVGVGVTALGSWLLWRAYKKPARSALLAPTPTGLAFRF